MIRKGTFDDAAAIAEIFNYYVQTSTVIFSNTLLSADDMKQKLAPIVGQFPFYVWEEDGKVLGYCYAHKFHPDPVYAETWELTAYLDKNATGKGIGTKLLRFLIEQCRLAGAHTLVTFVTRGNEPCERMMASLGFVQTGIIRQSGHKCNQYLDDVIYQLLL